MASFTLLNESVAVSGDLRPSHIPGKAEEDDAFFDLCESIDVCMGSK